MSCAGANLSIPDYPIPCQPIRGNWGMVLRPMLLKLRVSEFGILVLQDGQAEESLLGSHFLSLGT